MSHAGSPSKSVKQKGDGTNEQGKKNKLFWVKKHGKVEIMQRGKDGKLRPLNKPENCENDTEHGPDESATGLKHFSANKQKNISPTGLQGHHPPIESKRTERKAKDFGEDYEYRPSAHDIAAPMDRVEREFVRNKDRKKAFAETDTPPTYHNATESKGTESEAEDYGEDCVFHLSAREIAAERDRAERGRGTKNAFAEKQLAERRRRQGQSDHPAPSHPGPPHQGPHQGSRNPGFQGEFAGTEGAERERRRGESNYPASPQPDSHHPDSHHPGFQREPAERERLRGQSNPHLDPQRGVAETERAEREPRRGRSNRPTSPGPVSSIAASYHLDPQSTSPQAARGPQQRPHRGA